MKISAKIVADSISPKNHRITTLECILPRIIWAEMLTHRMFSRNAASSRAIPNAKLIQSVIDEPFIPIAWQKKHAGMQGSAYIEDQGYIDLITAEYLKTRDYAIETAQALSKGITLSRGIDHQEIIEGTQVTKQLANRLLEPFQYYKVLITATEWENFFELRCPKYQVRLGVTRDIKTFRSKKDVIKAADSYNIEHHFDELDTIDWLKLNKSQAEIHISAVAEAIWDAMNESKPKQLSEQQWHIPYGDTIVFDEVLSSDGEQNKTNLYNKLKIATARCARVSYTTVGNEVTHDYSKDVELHDSLLASKHASPFEHCAQVMANSEYEEIYTRNDGTGDGWCRNFRGFKQYREIMNN